MSSDELRDLYTRHTNLIEYGVDVEGRKLFCVGDITSPNAENMISSLHLMNARGTEPIQLWVNSCGGNDDMMLYMYDAITSSDAPIYTIGTGMICSAAALLLVCGDRRFATPNAWFMTHKGRFQIEGDEDEVQAATELSKTVSDRYWKLIARHTNHSAQWWFNKSKGQGELWLDAEKMIEHGVVDEILTPKRRELKPISRRPINTKGNGPDDAEDEA